jgi:glycosyltransferase involved in cell wall biosynthesis
VVALALRFSNDLPVEDEALGRVCRVEAIDHRAGGNRSRWVQSIRSRVLPLVSTPRWVLATSVPSYRQRVREWVASWRPDVVHVFYHVMAQFLPEVSDADVPRVLTQYEPGAAAARDAARGKRGLVRVRACLEAQAWARYERRILQRFNAVVVLTERDRRALAPLAGSVPIVRIPLGTVVPPVALHSAGTDPRSVLFIGNFIHPPNVDAALWLMRSIFPRVRAVHSDARLMIVGANPTPEMTAMAGPQILVTGAVEAVTPFLNRASVVAAPLRAGGGMRVKLLEALAGGKAVVGTPLAAEGLDVTHRDQLLIADDEAEFGLSLTRLLADPAERERLGHRAREWTRSHVPWSSAVAAYEQLHDSLVARRPDQVLEKVVSLTA